MENPIFIKNVEERYVTVNTKGVVHKYKQALYKCQCGNLFLARPEMVKSENKTSCGCKILKKKHGMTNSSCYIAWRSMKARCYNQLTDNYKDHGGRGIKVCDRWLESFENFYEDMGPKPSEEKINGRCVYSIDRIDNDGDYWKGNCKWADQKEQCRNRRDNVNIEWNGKNQCLAAWAEEMNMAASSLSRRINKSKWSIEKAMTTPSRKKNKTI